LHDDRPLVLEISISGSAARANGHVQPGMCTLINR
jgi:hypothetical protein